MVPVNLPIRLKNSPYSLVVITNLKVNPTTGEVEVEQVDLGIPLDDAAEKVVEQHEGLIAQTIAGVFR